jgi:hypothetical protein
MRFQVVDHDGRYEIVEFYDMPSVEAWEAENGGSDASTSTADPDASADPSASASPDASASPAAGSEG